MQMKLSVVLKKLKFHADETAKILVEMKQN